jgi:LysM repeat protein
MTRPRTRPSRRLYRRLLSAGAVAAPLAVVVGVGLLAPPPAAAERWPGHPGRTIVRHVVKPGDTATGLAVRYHAWTAELLRLNGLSATSYLFVGDTLRIPVVDAAVRQHRRTHHQPKRHHAKRHHARQHHARQHHARQHQAKRHHTSRASRLRAAGWRHWEYRRPRVKRLIAAEARRQGVPPRLAQAVAWIESGWHQPVVSSAGAIGVMQVLPTTGAWMSLYAGRPLNLRNTHDNVKAGVLLLRVLADNTSTVRRQIGAYYQGLGAVQRHGLYRETRHYVANVQAVQRRLRG